MILTGKEIERRIELGEITVSPFNPKNINPASIDLRLGGQVVSYRKPPSGILDCKKSQDIYIYNIPRDGHFNMFPGELYLMHTEEVIKVENLVTIIDGKSSIGRLGISIHQTAGYGDPGYYGQYTLEVSCLVPITIYVGMKFCQARFHETVGEITSYQKTGHYVDRQGPVLGVKVSQAYRQFMDKEDESSNHPA